MSLSSNFSDRRFLKTTAVRQKFRHKIEKSSTYSSTPLSKNNVFYAFFGRTELTIGVSKAKNCDEYARGVRFCVAPQKPRKNAEKNTKIFDPKKIFDVEK